MQTLFSSAQQSLTATCTAALSIVVVLGAVSIPERALAAGSTPAARSVPGTGSVAAGTGDARVDGLLRRMTLTEKTSLIHGAREPAASDQGQAGYWPGLARLGIPPLRLADGPPGVLTRVPSTGMTATMGLAATFSRADAYANGLVIGRDARALGVQVVLEPFINMDRDQSFVRAYNTFGEDPFLTGAIAAAQIRGTQSQHVMSQAKHYVAYDGGNDVVVDPQALHEIYAAPFVAAIRAGVSSIMCSYNQVNGRYACGNPDTLETMLRRQMGFEGFVTSDWGATHDSLFINAGLNLEMPGAMPGMPIPSYFDTGVLAALRRGQVDEATITRAVGRILLQMDRFGYLTHAPSLAVTREPVDADEEVVRRTAADAAVLLKNAGGALPLSAPDLQSLALIGPGAGQTIAVGISGEKALGHVPRQIGTYQVLQQMLGPQGAHLHYAVADDMTGVPVPAAWLSHAARPAQPGLLRDGGAIDAQLNFTRANGNALPAGSDHQWSGTLTVPAAGRYTIDLQLLGATGALRLDGKQVASTGFLFLHGTRLQPGQDNVLPTTDGLDNVHALVDLTAGPHLLAVQVRGDTSGEPLQVRLAWTTPQQRQASFAAAVDAARAARAAVVFAWSQGQPVFALPGDQDRLIEAVAAVNPNTIVVLNVSQPVAMPWLDRVRAVLQMWYPGDAGGQATADLLLGHVSPAGRLPFTWPARLEDTVGHDPRHPERGSADPRGGHARTSYSEGIFIGYRWFDAQRIAPLFPFGFGLSYTRFDYSDLRVGKAQDGGLDVRFDLHNGGTAAADEVPQLYLGAPRIAPPGAQFALRALAGFERVHLAPGQRTTVRIHVPLRQLQYWSDSAHAWQLPASPRPLYVGASSRDLRLTGSTATVAATRTPN
ncbi:MAG TPA: glycoside hydrolase family 3 C-terminal domain-containing protein [Steroidobacteraceae bacterium]|jgi:beta-glucosidase|nr:glycoside hydrolase family 3 C-terminal domain-containing protein [Steroidobacteraceae bacterium]